MKKIFLLSLVILLSASCTGNNDRLTIPGPEDKVHDNPEINMTKTVSGSQAEDPEMITIQLKVEGSKQDVTSLNVGLGSNALIPLKLAHSVETKNYEGIGEMVLSIDGIKPDNKHFWAFYANGKSSNVGASSYKLNNGDSLEWKLEEIK